MLYSYGKQRLNVHCLMILHPSIVSVTHNPSVQNSRAARYRHQRHPVRNTTVVDITLILHFSERFTLVCMKQLQIHKLEE